MAATFPLRHLPPNALKVVSDCMMPTELFRLSLVSKKAHKLALSVRRKPKSLELFLCEHASMYINYDCGFSGFLFFVKDEAEDPAPKDCELLKIKDFEVKVKYSGGIDKLVFYWDDHRYVMLGHLHEIYYQFYNQTPVHELGVSGEHDLMDSQDALQMVKKYQPTIEKCAFKCEKSGDKELEAFFDEIEDRITGTLCVDVQTSEEFQYTFQVPLTTKKIQLKKSSWLSLDNLFDLNASALWIQKSSFSSEDLNFFLKNWMNGGNSELSYLSLELPEEIDIDVVLNELPVVVNNEHLEYFWDNATNIEFSSCYEIKRLEDGAIASFIIDSEDDCQFFMVVWPDKRGTQHPDHDEEQ